MNGNGDRAATAGQELEAERRDMVARQTRDRGIRTARVLEAMETALRHLFVPPERLRETYADELKREGRTTERSLYPCRFVPLLGRYGWRQDTQDTDRG